MGSEKRNEERLDILEDIMFASRSAHPFCYYGGTTLNYSLRGLCVQSRYQAIPGDNLCVRMIGRHLQSFTSLEELTCIAEVRWCTPVGPTDQQTYRIGLHYHGNLIPPLFKP
ncbi:MAG: PilZ domain-containing protein [Desulfofustis sp.]|nr:PilZ domain-containing protein [Desulfofustis sp.]